jgi:pilus assembly protein CpaF
MIPDEIHDRNLRSLLAPIAALIGAPDISEIMINGPDRVYIERAGRIERTHHRFPGREALLCAVRGIAQWAGRGIGPEAPILEARLPDGSRVEAVLPPAAPDGPILSIRRFSRSSLGLEALVANGGLTEAGAALLREIVETRRNVLVAGGTGSGKTSLLNALARFIPHDQRVVVIEDARELQLAHEHVVHLEARVPDARGRGAISMRALFRASLRLRPDRVVVGEVRGPEAIELVQAMTTGHAGCLSTIHGTTPRDALARLETLALMSELALPLSALRAQIASAVHVIVQTGRTHDGSRHVAEIAELDPRGPGYALRVRYRAASIDDPDTCTRQRAARDRSGARS